MKMLKILLIATVLTIPFGATTAPYHGDYDTPVQKAKMQQADDKASANKEKSEINRKTASASAEDKYKENSCKSGFINQIQWEMRANMPPYQYEDGPR